MRIFLDTNVLLDTLDEARRDFEISRKITRICEQEGNQGMISAMSVPNMLYILRKELRTHEMKALLVRSLCHSYDIVPLERGDLIFATADDFPDYEDGLQCLAAEKTGVDYIVTNDKKGFRGAKVKVVTPKEFLELAR